MSAAVALSIPEMVDLDRRVALALGKTVKPAGGTAWAAFLVDDDEWLENYCGDWRVGGPLLESERITVVASDWHGWEPPAERCIEWHAIVGTFSHYIDDSLPFDQEYGGRGPTPLVAAMRALVAFRKVPA